MMSGVPMRVEATCCDEAKAGRLGARLMAIVAEGDRRDAYTCRRPHEIEALARRSDRRSRRHGGRATFLSGLNLRRERWITGRVCSATEDLLGGTRSPPRQLVALTTFCNLVQEVRKRVKARCPCRGPAQRRCGTLAMAATTPPHMPMRIAVYLGCAVSRSAIYFASLCRLEFTCEGELASSRCSSRQALPMMWDFAEIGTHSEAGASSS